MSKTAGSTPQKKAAPNIEKRKVPLRLANSAYRSREYLADREVAALMKAASHVGRHGERDATLILIAYRHRSAGLRIGQSALGSSGFSARPAPRRAPEAWHPIRPSPART